MFVLETAPASSTRADLARPSASPSLRVTRRGRRCPRTDGSSRLHLLLVSDQRARSSIGRRAQGREESASVQSPADTFRRRTIPRFRRSRRLGCEDFRLRPFSGDRRRPRRHGRLRSAAGDKLHRRPRRAVARRQDRCVPVCRRRPAARPTDPRHRTRESRDRRQRDELQRLGLRRWKSDRVRQHRESRSVRGGRAVVRSDGMPERIRPHRERMAAGFPRHRGRHCRARARHDEGEPAGVPVATGRARLSPAETAFIARSADHTVLLSQRRRDDRGPRLPASGSRPASASAEMSRVPRVGKRPIAPVPAHAAPSSTIRSRWGGFCVGGAKPGGACARDGDCADAGGTCRATWIAALLRTDAQPLPVVAVHRVDDPPAAWNDAIGSAADTVAVVGSLVAFRSIPDGTLRLYDAEQHRFVDLGEPQTAEDFVRLDAAFPHTKTSRGCDATMIATTRTPPRSTPRSTMTARSSSGGATVFNTHQAASPCTIAACDPRVPYRVQQHTVTFLTTEREQGTCGGPHIPADARRSSPAPT